MFHFAIKTLNVGEQKFCALRAFKLSALRPFVQCGRRAVCTFERADDDDNRRSTAAGERRDAAARPP